MTNFYRLVIFGLSKAWTVTLRGMDVATSYVEVCKGYACCDCHLLWWICLMSTTPYSVIKRPSPGNLRCQPNNCNRVSLEDQIDHVPHATCGDKA